jgi:hypothetical protein
VVLAVGSLGVDKQARAVRGQHMASSRRPPAERDFQVARVGGFGFKMSSLPSWQGGSVWPPEGTQLPAGLMRIWGGGQDEVR